MRGPNREPEARWQMTAGLGGPAVFPAAFLGSIS